MHLSIGGYLVIDSPPERIFSGSAQMNYVGIDHHGQYSELVHYLSDGRVR